MVLCIMWKKIIIQVSGAENCERPSKNIAKLSPIPESNVENIIDIILNSFSVIINKKSKQAH